GRDHRALDLGAFDPSPGTNRGVRADVGVADAGARTDHGRSDEDAGMNGRALVDLHPALDARAVAIPVAVSVDPALCGRHAVEGDLVQLQQIEWATGVLTPGLRESHLEAAA